MPLVRGPYPEVPAHGARHEVTDGAQDGQVRGVGQVAETGPDEGHVRGREVIEQVPGREVPQRNPVLHRRIVGGGPLGQPPITQPPDDGGHHGQQDGPGAVEDAVHDDVAARIPGQAQGAPEMPP